MKATLRKRVKNGKVSLYLDYYHKGKRQYEYLRLYLVHKPRTALDRATNKQTLQLAESIRAKRQIEIQNGYFGFNDKERINTSFLFYFKVLAEKRKDSDGNYGNWNSAARHLSSFKRGDVTFNEIDTDWLEAFKEHLVNEARSKNGGQLSRNSTVSYFNKVRAALKQAVKDGIITRNPAQQVEGIKESETRREFLTLEELQKLSVTPCNTLLLRNAFLFGCLTGLRFSDIQNLTWGEVQHSEENGHYIRFCQKKTKGQETLPISDDAYKLMGIRQLAENKVFEGLSYGNEVTQKLREWVIRAGIEKKITFHCSRHTHAVLQLSLGTDIYTVSKLLGHKSIKTTEIYAKVVDRKKMEAANRIKLNI